MTEHGTRYIPDRSGGAGTFWCYCGSIQRVGATAPLVPHAPDCPDRHTNIIGNAIVTIGGGGAGGSSLGATGSNG